MSASGHGLPRVEVSAAMFALTLACGPAPRAVAPAVRVRPGIEVLLSDSAALVHDKAVGLVSNQAGVDAAGVSDVDRLLRAGVHLVALFSPEHGFRGAADPGQTVASTIDSSTGLPIYSLYGATRAPTDSMLRNIDVLLVDLPDVGARYYTYLSTTIEVMRAAARSKRTVVVLDRPDPIGGQVQGNVLEASARSFVGALAMPMRPGMSLGELALLANQDLALGADLRVVPAAGWTRGLTLWDTGLPFLPPSPNLKDGESLFHYPGTCLFEGTALSVGRGTDAPYRQIGAPWLDAARVIAALPLARLPGVEFKVVRFTPLQPADGKYPGKTVEGIRLRLTDERSYDPTLTAVALLAALQRVHPDSLGFRASGFDRLAGGAALREAILAGRDAFDIADSWRPSREQWLVRREPFLIYR